MWKPRSNERKEENDKNRLKVFVTLNYPFLITVSFGNEKAESMERLFFFFFFSFFTAAPQHMEVPRLGVKVEL